GVLFGARVPVVTGLTQGCLPIGPVHDVTACQRNIAIALDGRPALAVLKEEIGDRYGSDLRRIAGHVFAALPIPGSDRADYVVRNLTGIDAERELIAIGTPLTEGGHLMFCRRDPVAARLDLERMLADVAWRLTAPPRGGIYITCLARGPNMFGRDSGELGIVRAALGDVPLIGFFGNGEFSHDRLYTFTGVLSLFL
ncbi:MAG: histidine kinase, partial [Alphaproteobacteria bacterium]|nr:histidine kinase [Alphaproteobacteria bacterium]